ncbi:MAG: hypothetical protein EOO18_14180 [Chryseobacterium sp.]|nr:MAG: hypothetical protein EOO18_14180 [Chryseobacterium sp.]
MIFNHDLNTAKEIDRTIKEKYPDFNPNMDFVYFHGASPESNYSTFKLPSSDVFGGSLFTWDGGNNWRIVNFFRVNDVGYYKFMDDKPSFDQAKDSVDALPIWPNPNAVKKVGNVVIVKIGENKGTPLPFE